MDPITREPVQPARSADAPTAVAFGETAAAAGPILRGRDAEMTVIGEQLDRLRAGSGSVTLIEGAAGIGKSRLIDEAVRIARRLSLAVGHAAGEPWEGAAELAPLLRALFGGRDPLLPDARLSDLRHEPERRYWMLEDLQSLLERRAMSGPMLVCLDDLQWSDGGTVAALRSLPLRLASEPVAWLLAARPDESSAAMSQTFDQLTRAGAARLVLGPLGQSAVDALTTEVMQGVPDPELLGLTRDAGGNPFFLIELLLGLREERLVLTRDGRAELVEERVPTRVSQGMRERLARMSESARQLAIVAASLGRSFSVAELATMLAVAPGTLLPGIEQLVQTHILREHDGRLAFRHDLIREAVRLSVPVSARRALDRQATEVLLAAGALATEVAAQLAASAEPNDTAAITILREAAEALGPADPWAAAQLSRRALNLTSPGDPHRGALIAQTTLQLHAAGRLDEATAFAAKHLKDVLPTADEAAVCLSVASMFAVSPDVRVSMSRRALMLPDLSEEDRARHWSRLVYNLVQAGRAAESRSLMSRAEAEVHAGHHPPSDTILMLARDAQLYVDGHFQRSLELHETAIRRGFEPGEANRTWIARHWRSELLASLDRLDESMQLTADGIVSAQQGRQAWAVEFFEIYRGRQLLQRGQIAEAGVVLEGRFEPDRPHQITGALYAAGLVALGRVAIHTADARLRRATAEMAAVMRERGTPATQGQGTWLLALQAMADQRPAEALRLISSLELPDSNRILPLFPMDVTDDPHLVRIALAAGDHELAARTAAAAQARAERNPSVMVIAGIAAHAHGLLTADAGRLEHGGELLADGRRPLATASVYEDLARVRLDAGDRASGVHALDRALVLYTRSGASWDAGRLRARLRAHGVRRRLVASERPTAGWGALTTSELAVARLVGQGLTNRETAERLFVSPHTVTSHVRHAFTKLGINSRVELSRLVSEHDHA